MPLLTRFQSDLHKLLPRYTLSTVWFIVILVLCWLPKSAVVEPSWFHIPNGDKIIHFMLFFVWAIFLSFDFQKKHQPLNFLVLILFVGAMTAVLTEYLQPIFSNRTCDWKDGVADMTGLAVALLIVKKR